MKRVSDNREIRDAVLRTLVSEGLSGDQLKNVDKALLKALAGYQITPAETHLVERESCVPEIMAYLVRKKAKGLAETTLQQYSLTLKYFAIYVPKKISDITEWDVLYFLDQYKKDRNISKCRQDTLRIILNGFFRYQADCGNIKINPMATIEPIKYRKNEREPLTRNRVRKIAVCLL